MKFTTEIDSTRNPDAVGEYLRSEFFAEDPYNELSVGCYSVFDWREDVEPLDPEPVDNDFPNDEQWTRGQKNGIICAWFWDGDGVLTFELPDGTYLVNDDCKKSHGWQIENSIEDV